MVRFGMPKRPIERIPISEFKAKSLALLERVRRTGRPIIVTKRGEPIAEVVPPSMATLGRDWVGSLLGRAKLRGNIVNPAGAVADWEALGD
jgi:prevent-host-death family protein